MRDDGFALVVRNAHPCGVIACVRGTKAIVRTVKQQGLQFMQALVEHTDFFDLSAREFSQIQFISVSAAHCNGCAGFKRRGTACLMIRYGGNVRAHRGGWEDERRGVLNAAAHPGIGIVCTPGLRHEAHHTQIKAAAAAGAAFKENIGEGAGDAAHHVVHTEDITMAKFLLSVCRESGAAPHVNEAVHVPLDIVDIRAAQSGDDGADHIVADFIARKVEDQLVAIFDARITRHMDAPVGMRPIQIAVHGNHFRLDPQRWPNQPSSSTNRSIPARRATRASLSSFSSLKSK